MAYNRGPTCDLVISSNESLKDGSALKLPITWPEIWFAPDLSCTKCHHKQAKSFDFGMHANVGSLPKIMVVIANFEIPVSDIVPAGDPLKIRKPMDGYSTVLLLS